MRRHTDADGPVIGAAPSELAGQFSAEDLVGHYRLSAAEMPIPDGWAERWIGRWQLVCDHAIPVMQLTAAGEPVGWIVGYPVSSDGTLISRDVDLPIDTTVPDYREIERILYALAGRFVTFLLFPSNPRVYLDPMGSLGILYCSSQGIAASSPFLIPYTSETEDRADLIEALSIPGGRLYSPFGLTLRHSVEWLMPNHYLDLREWHGIRHWPTGELDVADRPSGLVQCIEQALKKNIGAVVGAGPVQMSLTAGRDSRMLLACARDCLDGITLVTLTLPDRIGRTDRNVAPRIARDLGLHHRPIRRRRASEFEMLQYAYRTGCMLRDPRAQQAVKTMAQLDPHQPYLMGLGGEIGRANHWKPDDRAGTDFGLEEFLARRGIPRRPEITSRGARWFEELPVENTLTILDLIEIEQETGGYDSWYAFGFPRAGSYHFHPFNDRRIIDAILRLPGDYKRAQRLTDDVVADTWPELAEFPYNSATFGVYGAYRRLRSRARRFVTASRRVSLSDG